MDQQLIDRIYECSFLPELWPGVLDELALIAEAGGGTFFTVNSHTGIIRWTASAAIREHMATYVTEGWMMDKQRQRPARLLKALAHHPGFLVEYDVCTAEELEHNPTYRDFLRPRGFGWAAITNISLPTKDQLVFTVERDYDRGPVESTFVQQLDELRPHLARSALMSARLQLERARVASETLALIGMPALVFDELGIHAYVCSWHAPAHQGRVEHGCNEGGDYGGSEALCCSGRTGLQPWRSDFGR